MADMEERFLEAAMVERKGINGLAISGFVISLSAGALFAAALLCQLGVMLGPLSALAFGVLAGAAAACGTAHSAVAIGLCLRRGDRGAGFALAGLAVGTVFLALVLAFAGMFIVEYYTGVCIARLRW